MAEEKSRVNLAELAPGLIVAMPQLVDPNFNRTVVLLIKANEEGALGVVINRSTGVSLREFLGYQDVEYAGPAEIEVNLGGPVEQDSHLLVLHGEEPVFGGGSEDELALAEGVRLVTAREGLAILAERGAERLRCYVGYAGWAPGQLEWELSEGAWVPLPCEASLVFDEPLGRVWGQALRRAGLDPVSLVPGGAVN
ncbi:MAG: YqgE/AlgH family protein [Acidobacteriota bacterium]|nr:YqgE/AlgH family protein [Acidobacteriota bacterium]MDQ7088892.1 YqgE/AlgH family protein [Acidobacteriota bacterium]